MSDTPMTTDRVVFIDGNPWVNAPFAVRLELELNAANERIKRLEEAGDALKAAGYFGGFNDAVDKWIKVKEAKP